MGLVTEFINVKLGPANIKYYENLGYKIPRKENIFIKDSTIIISIGDLQKGSHTKVEFECDNCKKNVSIIWKDFLKIKKIDKKIFCRNCLYFLCSTENSRLARLKIGLSFYQWCINNNRQDILIRWDYEKTGFAPRDISFNSMETVYLYCPENKHDSEIQKIRDISSGKTQQLLCSQCNSLGCFYPESFIFWSSKNQNDPFYFSRSSSSIVYWKCENQKHEDYERKISASVVYEYRCPKCVREDKESFLQEKIRKYLNYINVNNIFEINHEHDCELVCKSKKTKHTLPYDNEIIYKYFRLIIETQGKQHSVLGGFHNLSANHNHTTPEFEFEQLKKRDEYKKQYALNEGCYYLEIPYWADDSDETWKLMIDDMLSFIYESINE